MEWTVAVSSSEKFKSESDSSTCRIKNIYTEYLGSKEKLNQKLRLSFIQVKAVRRKSGTLEAPK